MPKPFLLLSQQDRADILNSTKASIGLPADVLEKDVWICWLLRELFNTPNKLPMVFKGGTSLSKAYNAIRRMSEDLDITIDTTSKFPCLPSDASTSRRKKRRDEIEDFLSDYLRETIRKHLLARCTVDFGKEILSISHSTKETLHIDYPKSVTGSKYLKESIVLEFGGRNLIDPNEKKEIVPYLETEDLKKLDLDFPHAFIDVLTIDRSFWEKVTILHSESHRDEFPIKPGIFRHWYDVSKLASNEIADAAIKNNALLKSVVETKKTLYSRKDSNYELCLQKQFKLLPNGDGRKKLEDDFKNMVVSGMFFDGENPDFQNIVNEIEKLEKKAERLKRLTQLNRADKYKALRPTISICIVDFELFPNVVDFRLDFKLQNTQHKCVFCDDIEVLTLEVPKFTLAVSEIKTPLEQWMYFLRFGDKLDIENLPKTITSPEIHEALEALLLMSKDRLGRERYEARLRVRQDAYSFREGWKEAFLEQGEIKGEIKGEIRGRREGQREAALAIILRQLDKQLGTLNPDFKSRVTALGVERLESLGEALLKFRGIEDLSEWLLMNS